MCPCDRGDAYQMQHGRLYYFSHIWHAAYQVMWYNKHDTVMEIQWWKIYHLWVDCRLYFRCWYSQHVVLTQTYLNFFGCLHHQQCCISSVKLIRKGPLTCAVLLFRSQCCFLCPPMPSSGCTWPPPTSGSSSPQPGPPQRTPPWNTHTRWSECRETSLTHLGKTKWHTVKDNYF